MASRLKGGLVLAGSVFVVAACARSGGAYLARTPQVRLSADASCPAHLGPAQDVRNASNDLTQYLVPATFRAASALVCAYREAPPPTGKVWQRATRLDASAATALVRALHQVSTGSARGDWSCPADRGSVDVIAIRLPHRREDIDLWYSTSGCKWMDNGKASAFEGGNPSFDNVFEPAFARLVPSGGCQLGSC